ncbi:hypothetical protein CCLMGIMDO_CCLMGIMDO_00337 [Companilactobacillus crustorum]|uniref:Uncharacterized protein n=3 Tax=Companilactobacillus TaxID=2767879 RepID=A0A837RHQ3_9LACO|nr:hypothetical protein FD26_GL000980 [Companilactobacillus crustorum JCM 15951]KRO19787.1 hypothetical protein IV63_GL001113 [Companilactobacillus crustorum]
MTSVRIKEIHQSLNKENNTTEFIKNLGELIKDWSRGEMSTAADDEEFNSRVKGLLKSAEKMSSSFIPYSEITRMVFDVNPQDGLDMLTGKLRKKINDDLSSCNEDDNVPEKYMVLLKCTEHINLADKQFNSLYNKQNNKLNDLNTSLKKTSSDLNDISEMSSGLKSKMDKLTVDFVTILGIFTSITFATFGGLQLLGNVFGKASDLSSESVIGSEIMLGSIFLFGTYLILIALLTGLSKLTGKSYETTFPTRYLLVLSFAIIFFVGTIYENKYWFRYLQTHWLVTLFGIVIVIGVPLILDYLYQKFVKKSFKNN